MKLMMKDGGRRGRDVCQEADIPGQALTRMDTS